ncbi:AAA family ATPase [Actinomycetospora termitidis]|uniref:AAA family ATPase n=1 Tax=Actinomycetospora termitidis TaxID=3053470 RepID=A0ABT7M888_9PSEU|nr:AAA family ATPase [Actinomycetospora sp. Odt1-22]MDL5156671.1 AAA family ATPase [Actinomycetospora sp. Odt1-22]
MRLLSGVRIENFRSIRKVDLLDLDEYSPIIGLNSSGKSNILRALNLFFNDQLDEEQTSISLGRDYPDFLRRTGKRKFVSVGVSFDLSGGFRPRGTDDFFTKYELEDTFVVQRTWTLDILTGGTQETVQFGKSWEVLVEAPSGDDRTAAFAFIRAIQFRYVPNHIRPADFIEKEIQPLRESMLTNLRRTTEFKTGGVAETMDALNRVAANMLKQTSQAVAAGAQGRGVSADVPADFAQLAFQIALQTVTSHGLQSTGLQGSGTQSFTLLHVLDLLDRTGRSRGFGWKKASIWAVEEPESFLHAGLRSRFATDLHAYACSQSRQVFATAHQDEFVRVANNAWLTSLVDDQTRINRASARDALIQSTKQRVTTFQHPLMEASDKPLVLVEGKLDAAHLRNAIRGAGMRPLWRMVALEEVDTLVKAGGDALLNYLKVNQLVLASRPPEGPILVLRDWEDAPKVEGLKQAVAAHEYSTVTACSEELCNPELGTTFRGIERFLSTDTVRAVIPTSALGRPAESEFPLSVTKSSLDGAKNKLLEHDVKSGTSSPYMRNLAGWLDQQVAAMLDGVPVDSFLF